MMKEAWILSPNWGSIHGVSVNGDFVAVGAYGINSDSRLAVDFYRRGQAADHRTTTRRGIALAGGREAVEEHVAGTGGDRVGTVAGERASGGVGYACCWFAGHTNLLK